MVSASASHREGPEICPQPVYKRHCAEKFRLKITESTEYTGTDVLVNGACVSYAPSRRCVRTMSPNIPPVPAQVSTSSLDRGSKLRGVISCVKAPYGG